MKQIASLLAIVVLLMVAGCQKESPRIEAGAKAPDFVLNDINGNPVRLSDFEGKVVLLEFWATWCPPCVMSIPELNELQETYMDQDFVLLAISIDDDFEVLKAFYEKTHMTYPVLFDEESVSNDYGIYTVPTSIIVGKDGNIFKRHLGYAPDVLGELVQEALAATETSPTEK